MYVSMFVCQVNTFGLELKPAAVRLRLVFRIFAR